MICKRFVIFITVTEDDIGDPDDLDHGDTHQHTGVSYPGHSAKDLGKTPINYLSCNETMKKVKYMFYTSF